MTKMGRGMKERKTEKKTNINDNEYTDPRDIFDEEKKEGMSDTDDK